MLEEYQALIDELLGTPTLVRDAIDRADGKPSAALLAQIVALNARDKAVLGRLQRLIRETSPHLTVLPDYDAAVASVSLPEDLAAFLSEFDTDRGEIISLLMNLTLRDWERTATHERGSSIELVDEVEEHVEFDERVRTALTG